VVFIFKTKRPIAGLQLGFDKVNAIKQATRWVQDLFRVIIDYFQCDFFNELILRVLKIHARRIRNVCLAHNNTNVKFAPGPSKKTNQIKSP
jgi:hypothetical protein